MNDLELRPEVRVIDADTVEVRSTSRPWLVYRMVRLPDGFVHDGESCESDHFFRPLYCNHSRKAENATMSENGNTALVVRQQALAQTPAGIDFTPEQVKVIKNTIAKGATDDELGLFMATCRRTGLDPFLKQIYAIKRRQWNASRKDYDEVMTIQIGIDGMRLIAERTGKYGGQDATEWLDDDGVWSEVWTGVGEHPRAAKAVVYRKDWRKPAIAICKWESYSQVSKDGAPLGLWSKMPDVMLGKCAESLAFRKAFPAEMSGLAAGIDPDFDPEVYAQEVRASDPTPPQVEAPQPGPQAPPPLRKPSGIDVRDAIAATKDRPDHYQLLEDFKVAYPATVTPQGKFFPQRTATPQLEEALEWISLWLRAHEPAPAASDAETTAAQAPLV